MKRAHNTMEILPLLQSNSLPNDVIVNNIYNHLWRIKTPLSKDLKHAIIYDHFHFKKILMMYYMNVDQFTRNKNDEDYFLIWMENDMVSILNDNQSLLDGLSENLKEECPTLTKEYLMRLDHVDDLPNKVYELWKMMTVEKRKTFYELTCLEI